MPDRRGDFSVAHMAQLARLRLTPDEELLYTRQVGDILEYARQVLGVDTSGVTTTSSEDGASGRTRSDTVQPSLARDAALGNAPDAAGRSGHFRVPKVLG
jgi:aspartyl-tRNA(Asn)/glutamyl-tRNA(Gln) amidotransferase subunit C